MGKKNAVELQWSRRRGGVAGQTAFVATTRRGMAVEGRRSKLGCGKLTARVKGDYRHGEPGT